MVLLMIRHGEMDGNAQRMVQVPETPLNQRGLAQAQALAGRLAERPIRRILSSDLERARMTAAPLAEALGLKPTLSPLLQERNFGDFRGQYYASIGIDIMAPGVEPPNGESWQSFYERVERAWSWVRAQLAAPLHFLCAPSRITHLPSQITPVQKGDPPGRPYLSREDQTTSVASLTASVINSSISKRVSISSISLRDDRKHGCLGTK